MTFCALRWNVHAPCSNARAPLPNAHEQPRGRPFVVLSSCVMRLGGMFVVLSSLLMMFFCHFAISPEKLYVG
jgi:hypothetical protein